MDTDDEPSDVPQRDPEGDKQVTTAVLPVRTLTHWNYEIHGRGRDAVRGRRLADSPISHHNNWEQVASQPTYDTPSGVYDGGGACVPETPAEKRISGAQPQCDTQSFMFDGGGDRVLETPPTASDRLRKAYIIRVDTIKHMNDGLRDTRNK